MTTGMPDEPRRLRELESAERSVAAIVRRCTRNGVVSCWDSKNNVELPQCFHSGLVANQVPWAAISPAGAARRG